MEPRADDGDDTPVVLNDPYIPGAAMEPRADDGDDVWITFVEDGARLPQWSPVLMTGTTRENAAERTNAKTPQWSPVLMTGTTRSRVQRPWRSPSRNGAPC